MKNLLVACCCVVVAALLVVGAVSHGILRHIVQTCPIWIAVTLAARNSPLVKWAAIPCFLFWLYIMTVIWLFLLGWAHWVSGTFSPVEIAMSIVVACASIVGMVAAVRSKATGAGVARIVTTLLLVAILQLGMFRLSLLPQIAHR